MTVMKPLSSRAAKANVQIAHSVCPHDCPSTCALEVEKLDARTIGRVRGAEGNSYTAGVICAKVARYAERVHHPDRLGHPLMRIGPKGSGQFKQISWDEALDRTAEALLAAERKHGSETVWPYYYAGTMGLMMRDGINRLRNVKKYSGQHSTICVTMAWPGFIAGTGSLAGSDPREMADADLVVIWGTNAVNTQVNVMTHALKARKDRGARIVVIDPYRNGTAEQADIHLAVKPGTDGALACGVMHVLFKEGFADRDYLRDFTDVPAELEAHLQTRTPEWAAAITGLSPEEIVDFARLYGSTKRSFLRLGYGFSRQRNGTVNMHAALCLAAVTGSWRYKGGGAFHNNGSIYHWNKTLLEGLDALDPKIRVLDQTRIGPILTGDPKDLVGGPPVTALFIQNTNPMVVAPDATLVHRGFNREDLFVCVHENFMTETAKMADIVLPATQFLEHPDLYQGGGHQHVMWADAVIEPFEECRPNHDVLCALAKRLGAEHRGFDMTVEQIADETLKRSGWPGLAELREQKYIDVQPPFEQAHYLNGFKWPDRKFRFKPDWEASPLRRFGQPGPLPELPDHWQVIDSASEEHPFRMVTAPSRSFLNSSFNEMPSSVKREGRPMAKLHPDDLKRLGLAEGNRVRLGNRKGSVVVHAQEFDGLQPGVVIVEGLWPNAAFEEGIGINLLTSADGGGAIGGGVFHDTAVWVRPA
jgi:anaerobic selenocysteine-containing dehydrogenase